jgi:hypothetical protein
VGTRNELMRPSTPLSFTLSECEIALAKPRLGLQAALGRQGRRGFALLLDDQPMRSLSSVSGAVSPIAGGSPISAASAAGEPIYAAAQFRSQGLSVTTKTNVAVAKKSVDAGGAGVDMQQDKASGVASGLASVIHQGVARGVPPRGRPD